MTERRVVADLSRCTGCLQCVLACSLETSGGCGLRRGKLSVRQDLHGVPTGIDFHEGCARRFSGQCRLKDGIPDCVRFCLPGALRFPPHAPERIFPDTPMRPPAGWGLLRTCALRLAPVLRLLLRCRELLYPSPSAPPLPPRPRRDASPAASGYAGKLLRLDLSRRRASVEPIPEELRERFVGGNGLGAYLLMREVPAGVDAFDPRNKIIFATGPLNGTLVPMASKFCAVTKSPLTGAYMDSMSGSLFGPELKFAGYDALVVEGESSSPVYVLIQDEEVEFRDAAHLWGADCFSAQERIKAECRDQAARVLAIGPAGERRVRYACILGEARAFGSGGLGAVFGAKRLKALVCRGTGAVSLADPESVRSFAAKILERVPRSESARVLAAFGTPAHTMFLNAIGGLPVRNFTGGRIADPELLSGERMRERNTRRTLACIGCLSPCAMLARSAAGPYAGSMSLGPEFQCISSLGSNLGIEDLDAVIRADHLTDLYGLGQISAGNCIAWAMECFERGILTTRDTGGLDLRFGNAAAALEMLRRIAFREGLGDILAEGVRRASAVVGRGSERFACHVKGMEVSGFEPRALKSQMIGFAVSNRGPLHTEIRPLSEFFGAAKWGDPASCGRLAKEMSDWTAVANSLVWCLSAERVLDFRLSPLIAEMLDAVTRRGWGVPELVTLGERVQTLERLFNLREGLGRRDDRLPRRMMEEGLPGGPGPVQAEDLDAALDAYYEARGWDAGGVPTAATLERLGLSEFGDTAGRAGL